MPSPRTMAIGFTLACADHEKIVWRFVSAIISSAVMAPAISVVVMRRRLSRVAYVQRTVVNVRRRAEAGATKISARGTIVCGPYTRAFMKSARPEVFKFGGVAVGNAEAIRIAIAHVRRAAPNVAVVVSAMNGVTDLLLEAGQAALRRDKLLCEEIASEFASRHLVLVDELIASKRRGEELREVIRESVREMRSMMESVAVFSELTPHAQDALVARGERAVAKIFAAAAEETGIAAVYVDATEIIVTERRLGALWPNLPQCERAAKKKITPLLTEGKVVVIPGYIASGPDGALV